MGNSTGTAAVQNPQSTVHPTAPPFPQSTSPQPRLRLSRREALGKIKELVECPICLEEFKDPRLLPCHHSFCLECLLQMEQDYGRTLRCPNCNAVVRLQRSVRELPVDFRANSLLQYIPDQDVEEPEPVASTPAFSIHNSALGMLTCPVCSDIFSEPRLLDCGHSFCSGCLEFMMPLTGNLIHCPCCDGKTIVIDGVASLAIDDEKRVMIQTFLRESPSSDRNPPVRRPACEDSCESSQRRQDVSESAPSDSRSPDEPQAPTPGPTSPATNNPTESLITKGQQLAIIIMLFVAALALVVLAALAGLSSVFASFGSLINTAQMARSGSVPTTAVPLIAHACYIGAILIPLLAITTFGASIGNCRSPNIFHSCRNAILIGSFIGAAVLSHHYGTGRKLGFNIFEGALMGFMCDRIFLKNMRSFLERMGLLAIIFIIFGVLGGSEFIDSAIYVATAFYGALFGAFISLFCLAFLAICMIKLNFPDYSVLITLSGGLLGHLIMATISLALNPKFGTISCAVWGMSIGVGIGKMMGDVFIPMLMKATGLRLLNTATAPVQGYRSGLFTALGTLLGSLVGLMIFINPLSCFVGALLGLYWSEQCMMWIRSYFSKMLRNHVHCIVGGFVGLVIGVTVATHIDGTLLAPVLGCYIEASLLPFYKRNIVN